MTFKFIHFGDSHLSRTYPASIAYDRVSSFNQAFKYVIDKAIDLNVDFIIHTGDLFDKTTPWPNVVKFARKQLLRLEEHDIKLYAIRGNHDGSFDTEGALKGCALDLLESPELKSFEFIDPVYDLLSKKSSIGYRDYLDSIRIIGIGYFGHNTMKFLSQYGVRAIDREKLNILLLHIFIEGYTQAYKNEPSIPLSYLESLSNVHYIAVGHDHDAKAPLKLKNGAFIACTGSTEKWDFYESDEKIFYLVEVSSSGSIHIKRYTIPSPHIVKAIIIKADTPRPAEWFVREAISRIRELLKENRKLVLRIRFEGRIPKGEIYDIPLRSLEKFLERLKSSGRVLYADILPPEVEIKPEDIKSVARDSVDIHGMIKDILKDDELSKKAFEIFEYSRFLYSDEENLTRDGNLRDQAYRLLKMKISSIWGLERGLTGVLGI